MNKLRGWLSRLGELFARERRDRDLAREMESHLLMHIDDNLRAGMTAEEARRQALFKLGGMEQTKENYRDRRGLPWLDVALQDLRFGVRVLASFTFVAVLTLALGIGVNTAIFTAFDALVLRPRPVKDPDSLAAIFRITPGERSGRFSYPDYIYYRDHSKSFSDLALFASALGMAATSSDLPSSGPAAAPGMALGASRIQLLQLVMSDGSRPILCGIAIGIVASAGVSRALSATPFGLSPLDTVSFAGVSLLLIAIALLATWLPARRATEVDPMVALRCE
jgi:FtsX-like permease family protein